MRKTWRLMLVVLFSLGVVFLPGCGRKELVAPDKPVKINLIDAEGNIKELDLTTLEAIDGTGGLIKSTGTIIGPASVMGPRLRDILELIGGLSDGNAVEVKATDDYRMIFTPEQCSGEVMVYSDKGEPLQTGGVEAILALNSTSAELLEGGAPRLAFISEKNTLTNGHYWVKMVEQIRIVPDLEEWEVHVNGLTNEVMDRPTFESVATCGNSPHPGQSYEVKNAEGIVEVYEGVPLWVLVSMADGMESVHFRFNRELAREGYTVKVISADGKSVDLDSGDVAYNDGIFIAHRKDGKPLDESEGPLRLIGPNLPHSDYWLEHVTEIQLTDLPAHARED